MQRSDVIVVGGGVAGSCAALRAVQYGLRTTWILGDRKTAKASRSRYVLNLDNMAILSGCLVERVAARELTKSHPEGPEHNDHGGERSCRCCDIIVEFKEVIHHESPFETNSRPPQCPTDSVWRC